MEGRTLLFHGIMLARELSLELHLQKMVLRRLFFMLEIARCIGIRLEHFLQAG